MKSLTRNIKKKSNKFCSGKYSKEEVFAIENHAKKKRTCLMCGKMFRSNGPFNRRCPKCQRSVSSGRLGCFNVPSIYRFAYGETDNIDLPENIVNYKE